MEEISGQIGAMILAFVANNPKAAGIMSMLFMISSILKVLQPAIAQVVALTPSKKDDEMMSKAEASKAYKVVAYILDLVLRIKLKA